MKDILPKKQKYWRYLKKIFNQEAEINGYERIDTPLLEYAQLYTKGIGENTDIVEKELYLIGTNKINDETLALRPEGTIGVARAYIQHGMQSLPQPVQLYYAGPMFRYDRPQKGRLRQHYQIGFEVLGSDDPAVDARLISLADSICQEIQLKNFVIEVNSIGCVNCREKIINLIRNFYLNKKNLLCSDCQKRLVKNPLRTLDCKNQNCQKLNQNIPPIIDQICDSCKDHFKQVLEFLDQANVKYDLNPRLVRGLDYYNRTVFEIKTGSLKSQNSIGGGGRYDNLIYQLCGKKIPAIGMAFGIDRIVETIENQKIKIQPESQPKIFIAQLGEEAKKKAMGLLEQLRSEGISARAALSKNSLKSQLRTANKYKIPLTLILGQKEVLDGTIILRDMKAGIQEIIPIEGSIDAVKKKLKFK